jgi:hypothetical protein
MSAKPSVRFIGNLRELNSYQLLQIGRVFALPDTDEEFFEGSLGDSSLSSADKETSDKTVS